MRTTSLTMEVGGQYAFSENSTLKRVTIGRNVKRIGEEAFYNSMVSEVIFDDPNGMRSPLR